MKQILEKLLSLAPKKIDLTNKNISLQITILSDYIYKNISLKHLIEIEFFCIKDKDKYPLSLFLSLKLAKSKKLISTFDKSKNYFIDIIFAIYKENNRIKTKDEHVNGEDFLNVKISQLNWLFDNFSNFDWNLVLVDDGCPENSGKIAEQIINKNKLDKARVLYLQDAIDNNLSVTRNISTVNDSRKGGSIEFALFDSLDSKKENHILVYTDADLSTHLGQIGLLLNPIVTKNKLVTIGSRREKDSIILKKGIRNNRGKLFIYLWKRMLNSLNDIIDTQCGFKAFSATVISNIIEDTIEKKFAFDIELLLKSEIYQPDSIAKAGICWIDSDAESTTTDLEPYLDILKSISIMSKKYLNQTNENIDFCNFINSLDADSWNKLIENIPEVIVNMDMEELSVYCGVKVKDLINFT